MMGWGGPEVWWPLIVVMPLLIAGVTMVIVMTRGRNGGGLFRGSRPHRSLREQERVHDQGRAGEDPLAVLRERYARGEIGHDEFDRYLDRLIRTEPGQPGPGGGRD